MLETLRTATALHPTEVTTPRSVPPLIFIPPAFDLYEFDDDPLALGAVPVHRWFSHWNGLIGAPAEEVTLGWSGGEATVLVSARGQVTHAAWARLGAAHLAFAGAMPLPRPPASTAAKQREIERITSSDELWSPIPAIADGGPGAHAAVLDGFAIAYCLLGEGAVSVAAVGVGLAGLRIRTVQDWTAYDHDATRSFPLSDLTR